MVAIVVAVVLGAVFPIEIVLLLGAIILAGLVAFVWQTIQHPENTVILLHVVVHRENDKTALIPGAEVTLALPDPQIGHTILTVRPSLLIFLADMLVRHSTSM